MVFSRISARYGQLVVGKVVLLPTIKRNQTFTDYKEEPAWFGQFRVYAEVHPTAFYLVQVLHLKHSSLSLPTGSPRLYSMTRACLGPLPQPCSFWASSQQYSSPILLDYQSLLKLGVEIILLYQAIWLPTCGFRLAKPVQLPWTVPTITIPTYLPCNQLP